VSGVYLEYFVLRISGKAENISKQFNFILICSGV